MINQRIYNGKIISHTLWNEESNNKTSSSNIELSSVIMSPGLAGSYTFKAKARNSSKIHIHHGHFERVTISDNQISFYVTNAVIVNETPQHPENTPMLVIEFNVGEVSRLLHEDRWFKKESWFKVEIESLQLSIF